MPCLALPTQRVNCTSIMCIDSRHSLVGVPVAMDLMTVSVNACYTVCFHCFYRHKVFSQFSSAITRASSNNLCHSFKVLTVMLIICVHTAVLV